jgi:hypothetical protein
MDICDWFKGISIVILCISIVALIIEIVNWMNDYTDEWGNYIFKKDIKQIPQCMKFIKRLFISTIITFIISLTLSIAIPTSKTVTKMLIASVVTVENVNEAKKDTKELVDYIFEKISEVKEEN